MLEKKRPLFNMRTALENVPVEWLRHIEPKVVRGAYLPCWIWMGQVDKSGYPILWITEPDGKRRYVMVQRMIARMFWKFHPAMQVRRTCGTVNCVNPNHIRVTSRHPKQGLD